MQHDRRDDDLPGASLRDLVGNERDALPNWRNHVPPHAEADDVVLLVARGSRDVRADFDAGRRGHQVFQRRAVARIVGSELLGCMRVGRRAHDLRNRPVALGSS